MQILKNSTLVVVDIQNDFCPDGALGVKEGDRVIPILNEWIDRFDREGLPILVTRDWHPVVTKHFKEWGGLWPPHCVEGTRGAEFHPDLDLPDSVTVVSKGMNPEQDAYSAFQAYDPEGRDVPTLLKHHGVEHIYIGGLATDYCVKETTLDALRAGFDVIVIEDGIRAVNLDPGDEQTARKAMSSAGAKFV